MQKHLRVCITQYPKTSILIQFLDFSSETLWSGGSGDVSIKFSCGAHYFH